MNIAEVALTTRWWRFDRYEIRDGCIRPATGAKLEEYDFFEDYLAPQRDARRKAKSRAEEPGPHEDLANLDVDREDAILEWVHAWGLLGILPHTLEHVSFDSGVALYKAPPGWMHVSDREEEAVLPCGPGTAIVTDLDSGRKFTRAAHLVLDPFFTELPYDVYPVPLQPEFWQLYAEPVGDFVAVAKCVRRVMHGLLRRSLEIRSWTDMEDIWYAQQWISANAQLTPPQPSLGEPSAITPALAAPTLLAVLAAMVWLDLGQGREVRICDRQSCGKIYFTGLSTRLYCSDKCKKAEEMRRYRQRMATREGQAEGE